MRNQTIYPRNGYIGLIMLLVSCLTLVFMYIHFSPLRPASDGPTHSEGVQAIDQAQAVKDAIQKRSQDDMHAMQ